MKKILELLLTVILCLTLCACDESSNDIWSIKQTVDEFGDVTKDSVSVISGSVNGKFSNTATPESDLTVAVHFARKAQYNHYIVGFDLKEYNSTNATFLSSDQKLFKIKLNEEIITMNLSGDAPNGTLYLGTEDYGWSGDLVFNELLNGNDVRCIITIGSSEYNFMLESSNFASLCEENGYVAGATELTFKEAVGIFLEDTGKYRGVAEDTINKNMGKFEVMNDASIKEKLKGRFFRISVTGYMPVGDYGFPFWDAIEFVHEENVQKEWTNFDAGDSYGIEKNINMGLFPNGYEAYRPRYNFQKSPDIINIAVDNNLITYKYEKKNGNLEFSYQCRKITNNFYLLCCVEDDGGLRASYLLFSCDSFYDLLEVVETAQKSFSMIDPYI